MVHRHLNGEPIVVKESHRRRLEEDEYVGTKLSDLPSNKNNTKKLIALTNLGWVNGVSRGIPVALTQECNGGYSQVQTLTIGQNNGYQGGFCGAGGTFSPYADYTVECHCIECATGANKYITKGTGCASTYMDGTSLPSSDTPCADPQTPLWYSKSSWTATFMGKSYKKTPIHDSTMYKVYPISETNYDDQSVMSCDCNEQLLYNMKKASTQDRLEAGGIAISGEGTN